MNIKTIMYIKDLMVRDLNEKQVVADSAMEQMQLLFRRNSGLVDSNGEPFETSQKCEETRILYYKARDDLAETKLIFNDFLKHDWN